MWPTIYTFIADPCYISACYYFELRNAMTILRERNIISSKSYLCFILSKQPTDLSLVENQTLE